MAIFSFLKTTKPKGFNYHPIYYNEMKEEMKEREARIRKELGINSEDKPYSPNIKGQFRSSYIKKKSQSRQSTLLFLFILMALLLVAYMIFYR